MITPALGTPSALVGTNITGTASGLTAGNVTTNANLTGPITSVGNATSIASQTGTGTKFVVDNTPTLITPVLGVATATSINKMAITAPATSSTLAVADGKTFTASNTLTLAGTDSTTMTFPTTSATIARTDAAQTFTGLQTFDTLTTTGNVILGNASTDTLNVGNGDLIKDASGNVGIGMTPSASYRLSLFGTAPSILYKSSASITSGQRSEFSWDNSAASTVAALRINAVTDNVGSEMVFYTRPAGGALTSRMTLSSTGIVTMSAYGAGAATFSAAGVISSVSDETWKTKDGVPLNPDVMLKKLEPGYWYYNSEKAPIFGADRQLGFYAQNVNQAIGVEAAPIPEEGKPWGYYDRSVLAVTVMSLQKALATIESLTARLEALEQK